MGFIFDIIVGFLGAMLGDAWGDRRAAKRQTLGLVDCGLRVIAGSQEGLTGHWKVSRAVVRAGRLEFGRRAPSSVRVGAVATEWRKPRGREVWLHLNLDFRIVQLTTETATLEWAVPEDRLEWAMARVRGSEVPSDEPIHGVV